MTSIENPTSFDFVSTFPDVWAARPVISPTVNFQPPTSNCLPLLQFVQNVFFAPDAINNAVSCRIESYKMYKTYILYMPRIFN